MTSQIFYRCVRSLSGKEDNGGIKRALLESIASGVVTRPQDVERYAACTFFASVSTQQDANDTGAIIKKTVQYLVENEFVRLQRCDDKTPDRNKENINDTEEVSEAHLYGIYFRNGTHKFLTDGLIRSRPAEI